MAVLPNNKIGVVAAEINKAFQTIVANDLTRRDAQIAATEASQQALNAREAALLGLAGIADQDKWSKYDIDEGVSRSLATRNVKGTTLASFASEIKRACQPSVRKHVGALSKLANDVWQSEGEDEGAKPCRKAFQRKYHMFQRMLGEAANGRVFTNAAEVIGWAVANDPDLDYTKVFRRLKGIREQLRAFAADFPGVDGMTDAIDFLDSITVDELKESRERATAPEPANEPAPASEPEQEAPAVNDALEEALRDQIGIIPELKAA